MSVHDTQYIERKGVHFIFKGMLDVLTATKGRRGNINIFDVLIAFLWSGEAEGDTGVANSLKKATKWHKEQQKRHSTAVKSQQPYRHLEHLFKAANLRTMPGLRLLQGHRKSTATWKKPALAGEYLPEARAGHAAAVHAGKMWIFGGNLNGEFSNEIIMFNTDSLSWHKPVVNGTAPPARAGHSMVLYNLLDRVELLVFGGADLNRTYFNDMHFFNVRSLQWSKIHSLGSVPTPRAGHSAVMLHSKQNNGVPCVFMYVFGGEDNNACMNDVYQYNVETNMWRLISILEEPSAKSVGSNITLNSPFIPNPRSQHSAVLQGTSMYVFGGDNHYQYLADLWRFDTEHEKWTNVMGNSNEHICARGGHGAILLKNDTMLIFGGVNSASFLNDTHIYNFKTGNWTEVHTLGQCPTERSGLTAVGAEVFTPVSAVLSVEKRLISVPEKDVNNKMSVWLFGGYDSEYFRQSVYCLQFDGSFFQCGAM